MYAIRAMRPGGADVLEYGEVPDPHPGPGELLVEVIASGVNFIDTYRRSGVYASEFPHVPGAEAMGTVVALGPGVEGIAVGQRVAWVDVLRSYAQLAVVPSARAVVIPDGVDDASAAALPLQGITAHYLAVSTYPVQRGDTVLVHAAAGGVGLLLTQLAVSRGARVIGTVSTAAKEALAREAGVSDVIRYDELQDLAAELPAVVRELTAGTGVDAVYDGVGRATFEASLGSLKPRGMVALFGAASGQVPPFDLQRLIAFHSAYVTRPTIGDYIADREELTWRAREVFDAAAAGLLTARVGGLYPLQEAADAHGDLESRRTTAKLLLVPPGSPLSS
ncbi:NADPH2:quinone reductase [Blastococcus saxobsidens]|uniref:NADPH2:quinone reductase n=1 Tax=Blastococcus saxobsidens TaxID=138336 RepID=A0A4Q7Y6R5_9ACTN|nr:NADPH2:quinone reductase [Blastococcus saxobsidens]